MMVALPKLGAVEVQRGGWIMMRNDCFMKVVLAGLHTVGMWGLGGWEDPMFGFEHLERWKHYQLRWRIPNGVSGVFYFLVGGGSEMGVRSAC